MVMLWKIASLPDWPLASTIRLLADTGVLPSPACSVSVTPPTFTCWHRCDRVAEWIAETTTGWVPCAPVTWLPNCSKPVPLSCDEVTRNSWPDTEMLAAIAPLAVSPTRTAVRAAAGPRMRANRRHRMRPAGCPGDVGCAGGGVLL